MSNPLICAGLCLLETQNRCNLCRLPLRRKADEHPWSVAFARCSLGALLTPLWYAQQKAEVARVGKGEAAGTHHIDVLVGCIKGVDFSREEFSGIFQGGFGCGYDLYGHLREERAAAELHAGDWEAPASFADVEPSWPLERERLRLCQSSGPCGHT